MRCSGTTPVTETWSNCLPALLRSDLLRTLDMFDAPSRLASEYDVGRTFAFSCME
jgi:hypothetical protein